MTAADPVARGRVARFLRVDTLNRLWRTTLQGLAVTALVAAYEAARQLVGAGPVDWRHVGYTAASAAGLVVSTYVVAAIRTGRIEPIPLTLDGLVRTGRTLLAGALTTAGAAVVEVLRVALTDGSGFQLGRVAGTACAAAAAAVLAYFHRTRLDPVEAVPSAVPPAKPPAVTDPVAAADAAARRDDPLR